VISGAEGVSDDGLRSGFSIGTWLYSLTGGVESFGCISFVSMKLPHAKKNYSFRRRTVVDLSSFFFFFFPYDPPSTYLIHSSH